MRHIFIIQCFKYEPAIALGNLLIKLVPNCKIIYSYDDLNPSKSKFMELDKDLLYSHRIGYFTLDAAFVHINRIKDLIDSNRIVQGDYIHVISESDLPTKFISLIDQELSNIELYGYVIDKHELKSATAWYGMSYDIAKYISVRYVELMHECLDIYMHYNNHFDRFSGSPDEYFLGYIFNKLYNQMGDKIDISSDKRLIIWPKDSYATYGGHPNSNYGKFTSYSSPLTLEYTQSVLWELYNQPKEPLFLRKVEFDSDSYHKFIEDLK